MDLPGAARETISVSIQGNSMRVKADAISRPENEALMATGERPSGGFVRTFRLADEISPDTIDAEYDLGVLTITLFKRELSGPKEIAIR